MKVLKFDTTDGKLGWMIRCPGCRGNHLFTTGFVDEAARQIEIERRKQQFKDRPFQPCPVWGFNGNTERPTFTPSMLVTWGGWKKSDGSISPLHVCHSFVTDGRIQFLGDCTHDMKNQTVELPDMKEQP